MYLCGFVGGFLLISVPTQALAAPTDGYVLVPGLSDEFNEERLDSSKWDDHNPDWAGREPGLFRKANVAVKDGRLQLTTGLEGDNKFSTAAVKSKARILYGYFEIKALPMRSAASSAFWLYDNTKEYWTEIDIFELSGQGEHFATSFFSNLHVWHTPRDRKHRAYPEKWVAPFDLFSDYHIYSLEWTKQQIIWRVDGRTVRVSENSMWHQPLFVNMDSEIMVKWLGLPRSRDLPSIYKIDYIRTWQKDD